MDAGRVGIGAFLRERIISSNLPCGRGFKCKTGISRVLGIIGLVVCEVKRDSGSGSSLGVVKSCSDFICAGRGNLRAGRGGKMAVSC